MRKVTPENMRSTGQVVPTRQLITKLEGLGCHFRQKGSHITFNHDPSGIRGTIVYGSGKLWSQETVADAAERIRRFNRAADDSQTPLSGEIPETENGSLKKAFFVADNIPSHLVAEIMVDNSRIVLRDSECPHAGAVIPALVPHASTLESVVEAIAQQKREVSDILSYLEKDGDFIVTQKDGAVEITHPVLPIGAVLNPFDPEEDRSPLEILEQCIDKLAEHEQNKKILGAFIRSRRMAPAGTTANDNGDAGKKSGKQSYRFKSFSGESFSGVPVVSVATSKQGWVSDQDLLSFMDSADRILFRNIDALLLTSYGFKTTPVRHSDIAHARHGLLEDLDFKLPSFDSLPRLHDIYMQRETLGENEYIRRINDVLDKRDDILELVSVALGLAVEQMKERSDQLFHCMDVIELAANQMNREVFKTLTKGITKALRKAGAHVPPASVPGLIQQQTHKKHEDFRDVLNRLPGKLQYGKVRTFYVTLPFAEKMGILKYTFMLVRGPGGENLCVGSKETMDMMERHAAEATEIMGLKATSSPKLEDKRRKNQRILEKMTPDMHERTPEF